MTRNCCMKKMARLTAMALVLLTLTGLLPVAAITVRAEDRAPSNASGYAEELQALYDELQAGVAGNDLEGNPAAAALAWILSKAADKVGAEVMDSAWTSIFGSNDPSNQILAELTIINQKLDTIINLLNRILNEIKVERYRTPILAHNKDMIQYRGYADTAIANFDRAVENATNPYSRLEAWERGDYSNGQNPFTFFRTLVNQTCDNNAGENCFTNYDQYAYYRWQWELQGVPFRELHRIIDSYTLTQIAVMNTLYLQMESQINPDNPKLDDYRANFKVDLDKFIRTSDKYRVNTTPGYNTFHMDNISFKVEVNPGIKNDFDAQFKDYFKDKMDLRTMRDDILMPSPRNSGDHCITKAELQALKDAAKMNQQTLGEFLEDGGILLNAPGSGTPVMGMMYADYRDKPRAIMDIGDWHYKFPGVYWRDVWMNWTRLDAESASTKLGRFVVYAEGTWGTEVGYKMEGNGPAEDNNSGRYRENSLATLFIRDTAGVNDDWAEIRDDDTVSANPAQQAEALLAERYQNTAALATAAADRLTAQYNLAPNEAQRAELESILASAYANARFTVHPDNESETEDPYVTVDVAPLAGFDNLILPPAPNPTPEEPDPIDDPVPNPNPEEPDPIDDPVPNPNPEEPQPVEASVVTLMTAAMPQAAAYDPIDAFLAACREAAAAPTYGETQALRLHFASDPENRQVAFDQSDLAAMDQLVVTLP